MWPTGFKKFEKEFDFLTPVLGGFGGRWNLTSSNYWLNWATCRLYESAGSDKGRFTYLVKTYAA